MTIPKALAPTTGAQRKLGDSMHWIRFHTSDGLSEQWERGNSAVILTDRPDSSPFVKGYWREIGPFMVAMGAHIPGYRIIPEETASQYLAARGAFYGPKERDDPEATMKNWTRLEDAEENLAVALGGTRLLPPRPAVDGGLSPSLLEALSDDDLQMMSDIIRREPGFRQVNPINQRKAGALPADPVVLLEVLYNCAVNDSRLDPDLERQIRQVLGLDRVAGPGEDGGG